jgi:hypothetical protein
MNMVIAPYWFGVGADVPAPTFVLAGTLVGNTGAVNAPWPAHQVDDIGILLIKTDNQDPPATPTGCTAIYTPTGTGTPGGFSGLGVKLHAYWIRATSTSMPDINTGDSGTQNIAIILTFRGCVASGDPIDGTPGTDTATTTTNVTIPGLTTTGDNRMVVALCGISLPDAVNTANASGWANGSLESIAEILDQATISGPGGGFVGACGEKAAAGAVGETTATLANSAAQERLSFALKP